MQGLFSTFRSDTSSVVPWLLKLQDEETEGWVCRCCARIIQAPVGRVETRLDQLLPSFHPNHIRFDGKRATAEIRG